MNETLKNRLMTELGLNEDQVNKLAAEGVVSDPDLGLLSADQIKQVAGCGLVTAAKVVKAFAPAPAVATAVAANPAAPAPVAPDAEIPEGAKPSVAQMSSFASSLGVAPDMMSMFMMANVSAGSGMEFDLSSMFPIATIVAGYNPRIRNPYMMFMSQLENLYGGPIVVINEDGSVNKDLTVKYLEALELGDPLAVDDVYYDASGNAFQLMGVGVDAQGARDADPLDPTKPIPQSNVGIGRINWNGVGLEVRQLVCFGVTKTHEIDPTNETQTAWLRDHIRPGISRLIFTREYPKAVQAFNEAARTGSLPTLRVMPTRGPRRREIMARRRTGTPRNLAGLGRTGEEL
jgi:hypothetical protein